MSRRLTSSRDEERSASDSETVPRPCFAPVSFSARTTSLRVSGLRGSSGQCVGNCGSVGRSRPDRRGRAVQQAAAGYT